MRSRFFMTAALALIAGFLVVETQAFGSTTAAWIGFGVGIGAFALSAGLLASSMLRGRAEARLAIPAVALLIAGWNIVASLVFADAVATWLVFANGCALLAVSMVGLVVHELSTERVVHSLEIGEGSLEHEQRTAA